MLIRKFLGNKEHYNSCHLSESRVQKTNARKLDSQVIHILPSLEISFALDFFKMVFYRKIGGIVQTQISNSAIDYRT